MSVQISCEHCGYTYVAKADMAGKKVRCRNCGQVFVVTPAHAGRATPGDGMHVGAGTASGGAPAHAQDGSTQSDLGLPSLEDLPAVPDAKSPYERNSDTTRVMPAIHTSESNMTGGIGSAKSAMERVGDPGTFDIASGEAITGIRPSKPFDFPFAQELDRFAPKTVLWLLLLWVAYIAFTWQPGLEENQRHPGWSGLIPAAALLVLFAIFWLPLFAAAMRRVGVAMKFAVPPQHKLRSAALAALPFALGSVFWLAGESGGTLVTGVILGVAIAVPASWFLYRLREKELPYAAAGLAIAGVASAVLSAALYIGVNLLLNQTLIASGGEKLFIVSPMGPNLAWPAPERPQVATHSNAAATKPSAGNSNTAPDALPQQAGLRDIRGFTFDRTAEDVLFAPGRNDIVGVVSKSADGTGQEISLYMMGAGRTSGTGKEINWNKATLHSSAPAPFTPGDTCLSSDATRLAWLSRFQGSVTVHLWSFDTNKLITSHSPPEFGYDDTIQLIGFEGSSNSRLICTRRQRGEFQPVTVDLDRLAVDAWYDLLQAKQDDPTLRTNKMKDRHGDMVALSPDNTMMAVTAAEVQGTRSFLRIYTNTGKVYDHDLGITAMKVALDPVGLAFSPDGSRIAAAYVEQGRVSIFTSPTIGKTGSERAVQTAKFLTSTTGSDSGESRNSDSPKRTNDLVWLAGGDHWLYGKTIADGPTLRFVGSVDMGQVVQQQTVFAGQQLLALVNNGNGSGLIQATIAAAAPAEPALPTTRP